MTPNPDDLRRAKALLKHEEDVPDGEEDFYWERLPDFDRTTFLGFARAIRASDEAAGMVMVPRGATEKMWNYAYTTLDSDAGWNHVWDAMISAHEGGDGE